MLTLHIIMYIRVQMFCFFANYIQFADKNDLERKIFEENAKPTATVTIKVAT